ncbi:MAG: FeoB-associated Cys-rich membrane protein [Clostridiaceae bacterium]|nr:FeoB-associated Cys-rich membrane protein [Clostridiaceae bacterium]
MIENIVVVLIILAIVVGIIWYLARRRKKQGTACTGCPYAKQCGSKFYSGSNCDN